jgi:hypothetical protein
MYSMVGTRDTVQRGIAAFLDRTKVDELMITAQIYDHVSRVRSYEITAEVRDALGAPGRAVRSSPAA